MSFKCYFCNKAQGKGKRPTLLLTSVHTVNQYDPKAKRMCETLEIGGEKPACEACCATPGGMGAIAMRKTLGKPMTQEDENSWLAEAIEENAEEVSDE